MVESTLEERMMPTIVVGPEGSLDLDEFLERYPGAVLHCDADGEYWVIPHA